MQLQANRQKVTSHNIWTFSKIALSTSGKYLPEDTELNLQQREISVISLNKKIHNGRFLHTLLPVWSLVKVHVRGGVTKQGQLLRSSYVCQYWQRSTLDERQSAKGEYLYMKRQR